MPPAVATAGIVAGSAAKAIGDVTAANSRASADEFNASVQDQKAIEAKQQAGEEARIQQVHAMSFIGGEKADFGASGVSASSGSVQDVIRASAQNAEADRLSILHKGDMQAWSYTQGASLDRQSASGAKAAGGFSAAGDIMGGAGQVAALNWEG